MKANFITACDLQSSVLSSPVLEKRKTEVWKSRYERLVGSSTQSISVRDMFDEANVVCLSSLCEWSSGRGGERPFIHLNVCFCLEKASGTRWNPYRLHWESYRQGVEEALTDE